MENVHSDDAEKKIAKIILDGGELVAAAKQMPLKSQPRKQISEGTPTSVYFVRLCNSAVRLYPLLKLQPPFQRFIDDQKQFPDHRLFPDHDSAQAGVDWLNAQFTKLLGTYRLRSTVPDDFEDGKFVDGLIACDSRENLIWQNYSYLREGTEFPFPHIEDSIIESMGKAIDFLRDLISDLAKPEAPVSEAVPEKVPKKTTQRLIVSIEKISATLDGKEYDLKSEQQARWLKVLSDNPGVWISGTQLNDYDNRTEIFPFR